MNLWSRVPCHLADCHPLPLRDSRVIWCQQAGALISADCDGLCANTSVLGCVQAGPDLVGIPVLQAVRLLEPDAVGCHVVAAVGSGVLVAISERNGARSGMVQCQADQASPAAKLQAALSCAQTSSGALQEGTCGAEHQHLQADGGGCAPAKRAGLLMTNSARRHPAVHCLQPVPPSERFGELLRVMQLRSLLKALLGLLAGDTYSWVGQPSCSCCSPAICTLCVSDERSRVPQRGLASIKQCASSPAWLTAGPLGRHSAAHHASRLSCTDAVAVP